MAEAQEKGKLREALNNMSQTKKTPAQVLFSELNRVSSDFPKPTAINGQSIIYKIGGMDYTVSPRGENGAKITLGKEEISVPRNSVKHAIKLIKEVDDKIDSYGIDKDSDLEVSSSPGDNNVVISYRSDSGVTRFINVIGSGTTDDTSTDVLLDEETVQSYVSGGLDLPTQRNIIRKWWENS